MKLTRKAIVSVAIIIVLGLSSFVAWTQFFGPPKEVAVFETSMGTIEIELDRQKAPVTVDNFVNYVKAGFYNGTVIHRVASTGITVVQGGGFMANGTMKATRTAIKLESSNGLSNTAGTIAMARTTDPNSATSEFYINVVDNTQLDYTSASNPGYAVFGRVVSGMDVVTNISKVQVGTRMVNFPGYGEYPFEDWPLQDIVVTHAYMKP